MKKNEALKLCRRYMQERPEEWDKIMNELGFSRTPSQPLGKGKEKFQKLDGETINNFMKEIVPEDMLGKFDRNFIAYKIAEHFGG